MAINSIPNFGWSNVVLRSNTPTQIGEAQNLRRHKRKLPAHRWELEFSTPPLNQREYREFFAFINNLKGQFGSFEFIHPVYGEPVGNIPAQGVTVAADAKAGATRLSLAGFPKIDNEAVKAGDLIKVKGKNKVYGIAHNAKSDKAGIVHVILQSPLMEAVAANTEVIGRQVPFTLSMTEDVTEIEIDGDRGPYVEFVFTAVEDI